MARLPDGLGIIRVQTPGGARFFVSDSLTRDEEWTGRVLASERAAGGWRPFVALSAAEIMEAHKDARASAASAPSAGAGG